MGFSSDAPPKSSKGLRGLRRLVKVSHVRESMPGWMRKGRGTLKVVLISLLMAILVLSVAIVVHRTSYDATYEAVNTDSDPGIYDAAPEAVAEVEAIARKLDTGLLPRS